MPLTKLKGYKISKEDELDWRSEIWICDSNLDLIKVATKQWIKDFFNDAIEGAVVVDEEN